MKKKFISFVLIILIMFSFFPLTSLGADFSASTDIIEDIAEGVIEDEFIQNSLDRNLKVRIIEVEPILDDFALKSLDNSLKIQNYIYKPIEDELVNRLGSSLKFSALNNQNSFKNRVYLEIGETKIVPKYAYSTADGLKEGQNIDFLLVDEVILNDVVYKKGSTVKGRIETLSDNDFYGVPADIKISNFRLGNNFIEGTILAHGANRAIWVYPCMYALSGFFGLGLLFGFVRGGHAKLKENKVYVIGE